jgi:tol-pal system protein YbgF
LLGQSFLERFKSWSIDNSRHELVLEVDTRAAPVWDASSPTGQKTTWCGDPQQLYQEASTKLREGDYVAAERGFDTLVFLFPQHPLAGIAQYWLGETYFVRRDFRNALAAFWKSYKVYEDSPTRADSLLKLGLVYGSLGNRDTACDLLAQFAQDYPDATDHLKKQSEQEKKRLNCN